MKISNGYIRQQWLLYVFIAIKPLLIMAQQECQTYTKYAPRICQKLLDLESVNPNFGQFKGHNSGVHGGSCLVIELSHDIIPTNIFTKFDKDRTKRLRERKPRFSNGRTKNL